MPEAHVKFLRRLPVAVRFGDVLFVHAGVRPGVPLDEQAEDDLLWIREPFLSRPNGLGSATRPKMSIARPDAHTASGPVTISTSITR